MRLLKKVARKRLTEAEYLEQVEPEPVLEDD